MLSREQLEALPRKEVQHYAKEAGLKANAKTATLIEELLALWAVPADPVPAAAPSPAAAAASPVAAPVAAATPVPTPKQCATEERVVVEEEVAAPGQEAPAEVEVGVVSDAMVDVEVTVEAPGAAVEAAGAPSPAVGSLPEAASEPVPVAAVFEVAVQAAPAEGAPAAAVQDHGPRRSSERVRKSQESKARSKKQIESRISNHFKKTDNKLKFPGGRPLHKSSTTGSAPASSTPGTSAGASTKIPKPKSHFDKVHSALFDKAPSIVEVNAKRLEAQKRAATPKKALGPVGVNGANVAPIPMAPTTGPTKEKEGAARPATAPSSTAHTGGGGHSATAAPPKKKFNLQESLKRPITWALKTGKVPLDL